MKNYSIKFVLTFIFFTLLLGSCEKKEEFVASEKLISTEEMSNPENKQDVFGAEHNAFLDYFILNIKLPTGTKSISKNDVFPVIDSYYKSKGKVYGEKEVAFYTDFYQKMNKATLNGFDFTTYPTDLCRWFPFLPYCKIPYPIPTELLKRQVGTTSYQSTMSFIKAVKDIETKITNNGSLKQEENDFWLIQYSTARHSAAYWHNELGKQKQSQWVVNGFVNFNENFTNEAEICVACVALADVTGVAAGGAIGGAIVSIASLGDQLGWWDRIWKWLWN